MARYREEDVLLFPSQHGCHYEGDRYETGMGWFGPDWIPFTIPDPQDGWFDENVVDQILVDRWIWTGASMLKRHSD